MTACRIRWLSMVTGPRYVPSSSQIDAIARKGPSVVHGWLFLYAAVGVSVLGRFRCVQPGGSWDLSCVRLRAYCMCFTQGLLYSLLLSWVGPCSTLPLSVVDNKYSFGMHSFDGPQLKRRSQIIDQPITEIYEKHSIGTPYMRQSTPDIYSV